VNNDVARAGGLIAVAVLPPVAGLTGAAYLDPVRFDAGFRTAVLVGGGLCVLGGCLAALFIRNPVAVPAAVPVEQPTSHCGLDAPPLRHRTPVTPEPAARA
jgi:hypothetical protein